MPTCDTSSAVGFMNERKKHVGWARMSVQKLKAEVPWKHCIETLTFVLRVSLNGLFCCFFCFVVLATHSCFRGGPGSLCSGITLNVQSESEWIRVIQRHKVQSEIFRDSSTLEKKPCTTISIEIFDLHWKMELRNTNYSSGGDGREN